MDFETYLSLFDQVQLDKIAPYDDPTFVELAKLNLIRTKRWLKLGELNQELKEIILGISEKQNWIVITEHWCGDSANILPFIYKMSILNPLINLSIQLRDSTSEIESYLTNGKKSIPVLIMRDSFGKDMYIWNSRPKKCQDYFEQLKLTMNDLAERKKQIQIWYNNDQGISFQEELIALFKSDLNHILI